MNKKDLPAVFLSDAQIAYKVRRLHQQGLVKKLVGNLYTSEVKSDINDIVKRRLWEIVALLYPDAIIADRTAMDLKPNKQGEIFVISNKVRSTAIGDYTIYPRKGAVVQPSDTPFMNNLYIPSTARKFLENMRVTRRNKSVQSRYLSALEMEEKLDAYIRSYGETATNKLRDEMRVLAPCLDLESEFERINTLISTLMRTHESSLQSVTGQARAQGEAFDPQRVILFTKLFEALNSRAPVFRKTDNNDNTILCFYEAYFSNYIEGTKFTVDEAKEIVFDKKIPENRPEDAHDIAETYDVVANITEMKKTPRSFDEFLELLKQRHKKIMMGRPKAQPGIFKTRENQAGSTVFVSPELLVGTLKKGFELYQKIETSFGRSVFMMFLVSETHPFNDGNGRVSRIMMNAELVADNEQRIIIPTVYRSNYLMSLKALSHNQITDAFIKTIDFAQKYTRAINWKSLQSATDMLTQTNAFIENSDDENAILRLPKDIL